MITFIENFRKKNLQNLGKSPPSLSVEKADLRKPRLISPNTFICRQLMKFINNMIGLTEIKILLCKLMIIKLYT